MSQSGGESHRADLNGADFRVATFYGTTISDVDLSRTSRNQKGKAYPSAVRAKLDDPPIHIRPVVRASAGVKGKNSLGSGHYGTQTLLACFLDRKGFLRRKRQESGNK